MPSPAAIINGDQINYGSIESGSSDSRGARITSGAGAMDLMDCANGSLHMRHDGPPQVKYQGAATNLALEGHGHASVAECRLASLIAGTNTTYSTYMMRSGTITGVSRAYMTAPASASGNVTVNVAINGAAILASSAEIEDGLSANTLTEHALAANADVLRFNVGDRVLITVTAPADTTGGAAGVYMLKYNSNTN